MFGFIKTWAVGMAADYARKYAKVDNIVDLTCDWVNVLLHKATAEVDYTKMEKVCDTCAHISETCGTLATALRDGKISAEEASAIMTKVTECFGASGLHDEDLVALVDKAEDYIKSKI